MDIVFSDLKRKSRLALKGKTMQVIYVTLFYFLLPVLMTAGVYYLLEYIEVGIHLKGYEVYANIVLSAIIVYLFTASPLTYGYYYFLRNIGTKYGKNSDLYAGFGRHLTLTLYGMVYTLFVVVGFMLFIIPGILALVNYSMGYFILLEDGRMGPIKALSESRRFIKGYRLKLIGFSLSFIGMGIINVLTFGLLTFYITPYFRLSLQHFYEQVKIERDLFEEGFSKQASYKGIKEMI